MLKRVLLLVGSLVACVLVVELALRIAGHDPAVSWPWYLRNPDWRTTDPDVIMTQPWFQDDATYEAPPNAYRVLALGDSFTEGYPAQREDSFPAVLERLLAETHDTPVKVLNMGVGNSGTDQQLRLFKKDGLSRFRPDVVVWALYGNDLYDNQKLPVYDAVDGALVPRDATQHWLYRRQRIYEAIPLPGTVKRNSRIVLAGLRAFEVAHRGPYELSDEGMARSEVKVRLALAEMKRLAEEHDFRLVLLLVTPQGEFLARADPGTAVGADPRDVHRRLRRILEEGGFSYLEPLWTDPPQPPVTVEPTEFGVFADASRDKVGLGDRHLNEAGYRVLAEGLAAVLAPVKPSTGR